MEEKRSVEQTAQSLGEYMSTVSPQLEIKEIYNTIYVVH